MKEKTALIFPAFVTEFTGSEIDTLKACGGGLEKLLQEASIHTNLPLSGFNLDNNNFLDDELYTQFITYIFSCAFKDMLSERKVRTDLAAGYSMGIYAALYYAECISFTTGLDLISQAYQCIRENLTPGEYAMGITGGLEEKDLHGLMLQYAPLVKIINSNSPYSFVFSGPRREILHLIDASREEGALQARVMGVSLPYHSPYLDKASAHFGSLVSALQIDAPKRCIISAIDQREITSIPDVKKEIIQNIHKPFCWHKTIQHLLQEGTSVFIECGAGESLTKLNRFIQSGLKTYNLKNIQKFLHNASV